MSVHCSHVRIVTSARFQGLVVLVPLPHWLIVSQEPPLSRALRYATCPYGTDSRPPLTTTIPDVLWAVMRQWNICDKTGVVMVVVRESGGGISPLNLMVGGGGCQVGMGSHA